MIFHSYSGVNIWTSNHIWNRLFGFGFALTTGAGGETIMAFGRPYPVIPPAFYLRSPAFFSAGYGWSGRLTSPALVRAWTQALAGPVLFSLVALYIAIALGAEVVQRSWKDRAPSVRQEIWIKRFCAPLFARWFSRRMRLNLERNPIAWLQQYSWKARSSKWGLCGGFLLVETWLMGWLAAGGAGNFFDALDTLYRLQIGLALLLAAMLTYAGVNGFLSEKRNGALELLLVTPLPVKKIIFGRAWGLWKQFLPAALVLVLGEAATLSIAATSSPFWALGRGRSWFVSEGNLLTLFACANAFLALPVFGTYAALRLKNLAGAAALTWIGVAIVIVASGLLWITFEAVVGGELSFPVICGVIGFTNGVFIGLAFFLLHHSLSRRIYAF